MNDDEVITKWEKILFHMQELSWWRINEEMEYSDSEFELWEENKNG